MDVPTCIVTDGSKEMATNGVSSDDRHSYLQRTRSSSHRFKTITIDEHEVMDSSFSSEERNEMNESRRSLDVYGNNTRTTEEDNDEYSLYSTYTVDTTATSESVNSIISKLASETERRRRRLQRRRMAARSQLKEQSRKPEHNNHTTTSMREIGTHDEVFVGRTRVSIHSPSSIHL